MRAAILLGLVLVLAMGAWSLILGQPEWVEQPLQTGREEWIFYHPGTNTAVDSTVSDVEGLISSADSSNADNWVVTFTWDPDCQCRYATSIPRSGYYDVWRRSGGDTLYRLTIRRLPMMR
jgi:hypothetical protein